MSKVYEEIGNKYNKLTIVDILEPLTHRNWRAVVKCDCGNTKTVYLSNLRRGKTTSCGKGECNTNYKHGAAKTRLYKIWDGMKGRCKGRHELDKQYYSEITYCEEWEQFEPFQQWALANGYSNTLTIDRIDGSKDYSPNNCRWVDRSTQVQNCVRKNANITKTNHNTYRLRIGKSDNQLQKVFKTLEEAVKARTDFIKANGLDIPITTVEDYDYVL